MNKVDNAYRSVFNGTAAAFILSRLPEKITYGPKMSECYKEMFHKYYNRTNEIKECPTSRRCDMSAVAELNCDIAASRFDHEHIGHNLLVHYMSRPPRFVRSRNGCRMT